MYGILTFTVADSTTVKLSIGASMGRDLDAPISSPGLGYLHAGASVT
jgi:hypothetical protein